MSARLIWFAAGTAAGVYGSIKARRAAYRVSPSGVADQAYALRAGAHAFGHEMRQGMLERENQIAHDLGFADEEDR